MFSFCFRRSCFERIAITLQKVYSYCHSNKFSPHTIQISIQWDMIFWEKSQFADFMSSLFCSYGSGVVSKSYSKIKFTVRYVVPLCAIFVLFFIHALQPTLWSIKHEGVRPWKMGASLLNASAPKTMVSELPIPTFLPFRFHKPSGAILENKNTHGGWWMLLNVHVLRCVRTMANSCWESTFL